MECIITQLCDHKLVRKRGDSTEVRYIKDQGWSSVSSFHAYKSYEEAACVPTVRRIAAILQRSVRWFRCDDHYTPWRGAPCIALEPAEVDKLPVDVGHLVAWRHRHGRALGRGSTARPQQHGVHKAAVRPLRRGRGLEGLRVRGLRALLLPEVRGPRQAMSVEPLLTIAEELHPGVS